MNDDRKTRLELLQKEAPDEINSDDDSYGNEIRESKKEEKKVPKSKLIRVLVILVVLACIVFFGTLWGVLSPGNLANRIDNENPGGTGGGYPVNIVGTKITKGNFTFSGNLLTYVSDTSLVQLNDSAGVVVNRQISYSTPVLKTGGSYSLSYNLGGTRYQVDNQNETLKNDEQEDAILCGDINPDGTYAIVTEISGYLSRLLVYDKNHEIIYDYKFANHIINSVSLSDNGKNVVCGGLTSNNGEMTSAVYVLDFSEEKPIAITEIEDETIYDISFMTTGKIAFIGAFGMHLMENDYKTLQSLSFEELKLTSYDINSEMGICAALSRYGDGRACDILSISTSGEKKRFSTDLTITSISSYSDSICALSRDKIYRYTKDGTKTGEGNAGTDAKAIAMQNQNSVYILGISEIRHENVE